MQPHSPECVLGRSWPQAGLSNFSQRTPFEGRKPHVGYAEAVATGWRCVFASGTAFTFLFFPSLGSPPSPPPLLADLVLMEGEPSEDQIFEVLSGRLKGSLHLHSARPDLSFSTTKCLTLCSAVSVAPLPFAHTLLVRWRHLHLNWRRLDIGQSLQDTANLREASH